MKEFSNANGVFANDVLTFIVVSSSDLYGLLYTGREMFVIMSSGDETDEGKQKYLLIQLFYFRNYETDFGRVRLQIMFFCNTILL